MEEDRALAVAVELDMRGVSCRLERDAKSDYHLRVALPCDREAMWDLHGDLLEARVLRAGALVGFVPLPVPIELSDQSLAELIAVQRYEQLSTSSRSGSLADPAQRHRSRRTMRAAAVSGRSSASCWASWPSCWCCTSSTAGRDRPQVSPVRVSGPVAGCCS